MRIIFATLIATFMATAGFCGEREVERLAELLTQPVKKSSFAQSFLDAVPFGKIQGITSNIKQQIGDITRIEESADGYLVESDSHRMSVKISLDRSGQIAGLWFDAPVSLNTSLADAVQAFQELDGEVSYHLRQGGIAAFEHNASAALAVGSSFKLAVLAALRDQIEAGKLRWDQVATLLPRHKSLPSGSLHRFPDNAPLTLQTLATLMISISDNTATDLLMDVVGADAVAAKLGADRVLTTRQFFVLKTDAALREAYLSGKDNASADIARASLPKITDLPRHVAQIEWYVPVTRLCDLMEQVADLPMMAINPGVAKPQDWDAIAYKGGSERGVMNMTTWLRDRTGREHCLSVSVNHPRRVDEPALTSAYATALNAILGAIPD